MSKPSQRILELGSDFYDKVSPANFPQLTLRYTNEAAAKALDLHLSTEDYLRHFGRFEALPHNLPSPLALRYHGHQFQSYNPQLGDGRGFLFAQFENDRLLDLGTKGSGTTPYSRGGDGRLTLKGAVREALATEYLTFQGVPTSQTFCFIETHENLHRNDEPSPTRSAALTRMSHSHIRFGTFQRLAALQQKENLQKLLDYCVKYYYPHLQNFKNAEKAQAFLEAVAEQKGITVAAWMMAGFVHGVLNTDNMNITGESFDYGPYRFLPHYDPIFTAAYFDQTGLYAYGRQPGAVAWNLQQLAEALKFAYTEIDTDAALETFSDSFSYHLQKNFLKKLNLKSENVEPQKTQDLLQMVFEYLKTSKKPFEQFFFDLHSYSIRNPDLSGKYSGEEFNRILDSLKTFEIANETLAQHPYFKNTTCQSLLIDEIESIWDDIDHKDNWDQFHKKIETLRHYKGVYS